MAPGSGFEAPHDLDATRRLVAERFGIDRPYVLVVGENSANKSHSTAVFAFAQAAAPPYRLVLLQRLGRSGRLKRLASALGIADRVVWLAGATGEEVALLMQGAHVLLQPSRYEGFGLPVVEAMACGCPVIASDIPALHEVSVALPCSFLPVTPTPLRAPFEPCSPRLNTAGRLPQRESSAHARFHGIERRAKRRPSTKMSCLDQHPAPIERSCKRPQPKGGSLARDSGVCCASESACSSQYCETPARLRSTTQVPRRLRRHDVQVDGGRRAVVHEVLMQRERTASDGCCSQANTASVARGMPY